METHSNMKPKPSKRTFLPMTKEEKEAFVKEMHTKLVDVGGFKHYGTYYVKSVPQPYKRTISVYLHTDCFEILIDEGAGREGWFAQKHDYHPGSMKRIEEIL